MWIEMYFFTYLAMLFMYKAARTSINTSSCGLFIVAISSHLTIQTKLIKRIMIQQLIPLSLQELFGFFLFGDF